MLRVVRICVSYLVAWWQMPERAERSRASGAQLNEAEHVLRYKGLGLRVKHSYCNRISYSRKYKPPFSCSPGRRHEIAEPL